MSTKTSRLHIPILVHAVINPLSLYYHSAVIKQTLFQSKKIHYYYSIILQMQNGQHFADNIFIFLNENCSILISSG